MKLLCISDTHQNHKNLSLVECDVLLIAGDVCSTGDIWQLETFCEWLKGESHKFSKCFIVAGNHDYCFQNTKPLCKEILGQFLGNKLEYLEDSEFIYGGLKFYGSPWQPEFGRWAFNAKRGSQLKQIWDNIPSDVNVLLTHCPPHGIGDLVGTVHAGCADLFNRIRDLPELLIHVFGHIHEGHGVYTSDAAPNVNFCNASICTARYKPTNPATEIVIQNIQKFNYVSFNHVSLSAA